MSIEPQQRSKTHPQTGPFVGRWWLPVMLEGEPTKNVCDLAAKVVTRDAILYFHPSCRRQAHRQVRFDRPAVKSEHLSDCPGRILQMALVLWQASAQPSYIIFI